MSLYEILELQKDATDNEIKLKYRKMALEYHPDRGGDEQKFQDINRAYAILSNKQKRQLYDEHGEESVNELEQESSNINPNDILQQLFEQQSEQTQSHKLNIVHPLPLTLEELHNGCTKKINIPKQYFCELCEGTGSSSKVSYKCTKCDGKGINVVVKQMGSMIQQMQIPCNECEGRGHNIPADDICPQCKGKGVYNKIDEVEIKVEAGLCNKQKIVLQEGGHCDSDNRKGDLILIVQERKHSMFRRSGNNLIYRKNIHLGDALYGTKFIIEHIDKTPLLVKSKVVITPYKTYKLPGWGINKKGDLIMEFNIIFPTKQEIKPAFRPHIKKYLKTEDEIDEVGMKTATLIENEDIEDDEENEMPEGAGVPLGQACAQQ